jgi:hypothetical protein
MKVNKYSVYSKYQNNSCITELPKSWQLILNKDVIINRILRKTCNESTIKLLHHMCWGDKDLSDVFIQLVVTTIKEYKYFI